MRTLFLNPPSFEKFDGGASSRWPATREIESYWYPVWLCYPAGMLADSKVVDAPPHGISTPREMQSSGEALGFGRVELTVNYSNISLDDQKRGTASEGNPQ